MKKIIILFSLVLLLTHSCFDSDLVFEDQFEQVVQAYLYQGDSIENIKITKMISFGDDTTGGEGILDAKVELQRGDMSWILDCNAEDSTYYLDDFVDMQPGDTFHLQIAYEDELITSSTVIPEQPPVITMSDTVLVIERMTTMEDFRDRSNPDPIELSWDNPDDRYLFFWVQNIEETEDLIRPEPPDDMPFKGGGFNFQMVTSPTNDDTYSITTMEFTHYGTHRIIVYGVNEEYVALYNTTDQDSRELNEPFSNIENGLGIFTAFTSDTLYLEVADQ